MAAEAEPGSQEWLKDFWLTPRRGRWLEQSAGRKGVGFHGAVEGAFCALSPLFLVSSFPSEKAAPGRTFCVAEVGLVGYIQ